MSRAYSASAVNRQASPPLRPPRTSNHDSTFRSRILPCGLAGTCRSAINPRCRRFARSLYGDASLPPLRSIPPTTIELGESRRVVMAG